MGQGKGAVTKPGQFRERGERGQTEVTSSLSGRRLRRRDTMAHYNGHQINGATGNNGVTPTIPELNGDTHVPGASAACPEDAAVRQITASPSEFDRYLLGDAEVNWGTVKPELGLEEQTASLTIQEHPQEFQQAGPSTSTGIYSSLFVSSKSLKVLWREGGVGVVSSWAGSRG